MKTLRRFIEEDDMDFDEAAESAVAKRKFLLNRLMKKKLLPDDGDEEEVAEGEVVIHWTGHVILIRVCNTPHKMNCSNQHPGNGKMAVCIKAYDFCLGLGLGLLESEGHGKYF